MRPSILPVPGFIPAVLEQHAEDAAFVWVQRDRLVRGAPVSRAQLSRFDSRVDANLDGLLIAGAAGRDVAREALSPRGGPGLFPAFFLALNVGLADGIETLLALAAATQGGHRPLAAALAWLEPARAVPLARVLAAAPNPLGRRIAVTGLVAHSARDLPAALLSDPHPLARARSLRAAGELGRNDLCDALAKALQQEDAGCREAAAWSLVRLGDPRGAGPLLLASQAETDGGLAALDLVVRTMPLPRAVTWLKALAEDPQQARRALRGIGMLGDPALVPLILRAMDDPILARRAAEALTLVTGLDLAAEGVEGAAPASFRAGPSDDPAEEDVEPDPDEDLPWPDPLRVAGWWRRHADRFPAGQRLLLGKPVEPWHLRRVLRDGLQPHRAAAALELALQHPAEMLFDVRAPLSRQARALPPLREEPQ
jgi:uncharacterized protein (TIGR02270 family)